ncbi:MAG: non-homologous end-joining DNA ligase [Methanomassiliicoccus sp.]|nr:non-homologous end-joining DNA ligase [Methanomassiliicoccus sp.]
MAIYDGVEVEVTNRDKVLYPRDGLTKGDVIDYYSATSRFILPHIEGRPVSMLRYPDGIDGESFYQKQVSERFPPWFRTVAVRKKGGQVVHAVCEKEADMVYLANLACLTPHVWLSRASSLERPDRMILDMDPSDKDFSVVKDAARSAAKELRGLGLTPFVMTTGSRGLHVTVPLDRVASFEEVLSLAKMIASRMVEGDERFTTERLVEARSGRLLVDVYRNSYAQTAVPPYALRARDGAPVATPLEWSELEGSGLNSRSFSISSVLARLEERGDPWRAIERSSGSVKEAIARARR